jgi:hypothetical protein
MKNFLILPILTLLNLFAKAQNGGQFYQNKVIRLGYLGYAAGTHTFKVVNKQNCQVTIRTKADNDAAIDIVVPANDSSYVNVFRGTPGNVKFRVKAETSCPNFTNPDMGWLELNTSNFTLPLDETRYEYEREKRDMSVILQQGRWLQIETNNSKHYDLTVDVFNLNGVRLFYSRSKLYKSTKIDFGYRQSGLILVKVVIEDGVQHIFSIKTIQQ